MSIADELREMFPHGDPIFTDITLEELKLHSCKNHDYARGGDTLGNFYRVGNILSNYPGLDTSDPAVVALTYMLKQLDAILWMKCQSYEGDVEGLDPRYGDSHTYIKLARVIERRKKNDSP